MKKPTPKSPTRPRSPGAGYSGAAALPVGAGTLDGVLEAFSHYRLLTFDRDPGIRAERDAGFLASGGRPAPKEVAWR